MQILLSTPYHYSAYAGGNEQYAHQLATGLSQYGHQVTYLTGKAKPIQSNYHIVQTPVFHLAGKPLPSVAWIKQLLNIKFDIYHAAGHDLTALISGAFCRHHPSVITYQGHNHSPNLFLKTLSKASSHAVPRIFQNIITTTPAYQHALQSMWPKQKVVFIPLMLSSHLNQNHQTKVKAKISLGFDADLKHLLVVAKLDQHQYYKGIDVLIKSLVHLPSTYHLHLIGDGNQKSTYQNLAQQLNLHQRCHFHGFVSNQELSTYYQAADAFILPSTSSSEGFGLVLIEAMHHHTPTITTTAIGPAAWYHQARVTNLVSPNQAIDLAKTIQHVITHPNPKQVDRAFQFSKQFSLDNMVHQTIQLYQSILNQSNNNSTIH